MDLHLSVFLLFVLFTAGHSLNCYECFSSTGSCATQKLKTCPSGFSKCISSFAVTQVGDISTKVIVKDCAPDCSSLSMNFGIIKTSVSCCNTELCNVKDAPDPSTTVPNGKTCYTCDDKSCSKVLSCTGSEDRCIAATGNYGGQSAVVKGCVSKFICDATALVPNVPNVEGIACCEGNLCNGAQSVTHSFLFLCCSLLSYFLLH
ncbi:urokinase plasminogen activator surface receptor-like [Megalobrama amblycephala]|uniref:urokinase plasminogen activator surface receptor-like n=1 Tax=Megalobrama amblycephala TaxID=75352 RepID=UPI0020146CD2|nr:urokinase plasminogen activator surface receptor-like [Megalobrama amblycephala]